MDKETKKLVLYVELRSLQFFAEPPAGDGTPPPTGDDTPPTGDDTPPTGDGTPPTGDGTPPVSADTKTFTQEDVNRIAAAEARKATEKVLKDVGITDFENAKDGLEKYKEFLENQKTDEQKRQEQFAKLESERGTLAAQNEQLNFKVAALSNEVDPVKLDDVFVLVKARMSSEEDLTMENATKKVLEAYPTFKKGASETPPALGTWSTGSNNTGGSTTKTKLEERLSKYKK